MAGATISASFPRVGTIKTTSPGLTFDAFVARLNATGDDFVFSTLLGGSESEAAQSIALDAAGAMYISGWTRSPEVHSSARNNQDVFVMKLVNGCTYTVNPVSLPVSSASQIRTIAVDTPAGCAWTAAASGGFATIVGGASSVGPGWATVSVQGNPGLARTGSLTVAGRTIPLTQTGNISAGCTYTLSAPNVSVGAGTSNASVNIMTTAGCAWEAYSSAPWLQVFPLSGSGNGTLFYSVYPNLTTAPRTATITTGGQTFTVNQASNALNADQRFVQLVYFSFFGRLPSADELNFQITNALSGSTKDYAGLVMNFLNSQEFNDGGRFVAGLYVGLLDRNAEFGGWQFQRNALTQAIVSPQSLVNNFLSGAEYASRFGSPDNATFVRLLYRYVLLREATQAEVDFQAAQLQPAGGATRADLAINFLTGNEFRQGTGPRLTAFLLYATLLLRDPSPADMQSRIEQLTGASQATIKQTVAEIIQSAEFRSVVGW